MLASVLHEYFLSDAFAGREGQTPPFEGRVHAAPALAKNTLMTPSGLFGSGTARRDPIFGIIVFDVDSRSSGSAVVGYCLGRY
jgi:hypothetical protein